ncbi:acyltransferase family protein [Butyrivibrio sp. MB2005]|uniref:acyltransferase family protein n=1 Tax=Butyrivibrio sp. MB2005 TaxID=1280678 RepID=UPI000412474A|nr:acyltransferase [Butyrivibrio sp. MB2005]
MKNDSVIGSKTNQRNDYIDFLRGVAAIGIVAIHTAFWSGESYTPEWFQSITLLLDVPFFFFLSGWGSGYSNVSLKKTIKSLSGIWTKWIVFVIFLEMACVILQFLHVLGASSGLLDGRDFVNNVFFHVGFSGFPVVAGSIWFMPVYFVVLLCNTIILCLVRCDFLGGKEIETYILIFVFLFLWIYNGNSFLGLDTSIATFLFYSIFWTIGFYLSKSDSGLKLSRMKLVRDVVIILIGAIVTNYLQHLPIYNIQAAKFPPSPKYGIVSLLSIEIAIFVQPFIKKGIIYKLCAHVGRNAIYYFFAQGVGSSLIYYYVKHMDIEYWIVKWTGAFLINLALTIIIAELMGYAYRHICNMSINIFRMIRL